MLGFDLGKEAGNVCFGPAGRGDGGDQLYKVLRREHANAIGAEHAIWQHQRTAVWKTVRGTAGAQTDGIFKVRGGVYVIRRASAG